MTQRPSLLQHVVDSKLFKRGDRVVVASGGGTASLGLLAFLYDSSAKLQISTLAAVTVTDTSEESEDEVAEVGNAARKLGVDFFAITKDKGSVVSNALRMGKNAGFSRVVVGHTQQDFAAMVLEKLCIRRGIRRLQPWVAKRKDGLVRPLLSHRQEDAWEFAVKWGLAVGQTQHKKTMNRRGYLVQTVIPRLQAEYPDADQILIRNITQMVAWQKQQLK